MQDAIKSNRLACPTCGGVLECYKTFPRPTRVRRIKRCTSCGVMHETIETFKTLSPDLLPVTRMPPLTIEHPTRPAMIDIDGFI